MDEHLLAIIRAAEDGLECPPVRVLTGGLVAWGAPGASTEFLEASLEPMIEQYDEFVRGRSRRERKEEYIDPADLANDHLANVRWPTLDRQVEPQSLTLMDVYLWPVAGGDALMLPTLRVPVQNIEAWWIAGGGVLPAKDAGSWFVGLEFPLGE
jgi:hypothetical protein